MQAFYKWSILSSSKCFFNWKYKKKGYLSQANKLTACSLVISYQDMFELKAPPPF